MANAGAATFDGSTNYLTRGADYDGNSDSGNFTFMVFFKRSTIGVEQNLLQSGSDAFDVFIDSSNILWVRVKDTGGTFDLVQVNDTALTDTSNWHVVLVSTDGANFNLYIDDAEDDAAGGTLNDDTFDLTSSNHAVGGTTGGTALWDGDLGPVWVAHGFYLDITSAANRRLFHTADSPPKLSSGLNASASYPGASPILWLNNPSASYETNLGSGGGMTENGTLGATTGPEIEAAGGFSPSLFPIAQSQSTLLRM